MNPARSCSIRRLSLAMATLSLLAVGTVSACSRAPEAVGSGEAADLGVCSLAPNDDYPYASSASCNPPVGKDPWGFYQGQCTSFVAFRLNQRGLTFNNRMQGGHFGNAEHWDDNARNLGYTVDDTPAPDAIAVWDAEHYGRQGHVAVVKCVGDDGTVVVEEYNLHLDCKYGIRTISDTPPDHYIHIP